MKRKNKLILNVVLVMGLMVGVLFMRGYTVGRVGRHIDKLSQYNYIIDYQRSNIDHEKLVVKTMDGYISYDYQDLILFSRLSNRVDFSNSQRLINLGNNNLIKMRYNDRAYRHILTPSEDLGVFAFIDEKVQSQSVLDFHLLEDTGTSNLMSLESDGVTYALINEMLIEKYDKTVASTFDIINDQGAVVEFTTEYRLIDEMMFRYHPSAWHADDLLETVKKGQFLFEYNDTISYSCIVIEEKICEPIYTDRSYYLLDGIVFAVVEQFFESKIPVDKPNPSVYPLHPMVTDMIIEEMLPKIITNNP